MSRYVDLSNPKIFHNGRDKFGNGIYHIPPDLPTDDVVERKKRDRRMTFEDFMDICKYYHVGFDIDRNPCDTCRKPDNIPHGSSWGECDEEHCPLWVERKKQ